jgi:hypothetical protein
VILAHRDLRACAAVGLVCAALALAVHLTAIRAIAAVPLCLVLPGYALTAAFFARRRLEPGSTVMLTLALSLTTLILGALVLNLIPGALRAGPWAALLLVAVLGGCLVADRRRPALVLQPGRPRRGAAGRRWRALDAVLLGAAALIAAGAFVVSRIPLSAPSAVGYTALWMLPDRTVQGPVVNIGVQSSEQVRWGYRLIVQIGSVSLADRRFSLAPDGRIAVRVAVPARLQHGGTVIARLYRSDLVPVYRMTTARF